MPKISQLDLLINKEKQAKKNKKKKAIKQVIVPKFKIENDGNRLVALLQNYRLPSRANLQEHWAVKAKRTREQRKGIQNILRTANYNPKLPITIVLCRIAPRELDSDDNITMAFKAIRDGITDYLGLTNDNDIRLKWKYDQQSGAPKYYAVRVTLDHHVPSLPCSSK